MSCIGLQRKLLIWKLLNQYGKDLTPVKIELIHIMLFRDWDAGFKISVQRERIVEALQNWVDRFLKSELDSSFLYKRFLDIEPFYFGNEDVARILLRWRDRRIRSEKLGRILCDIGT